MGNNVWLLRKEVLVMENLGLVSNFIEIGQLLFGPDVKIRYEVKNDHEDPDPAQIIFYLEREIENITYTAEKQYTMFLTAYGDGQKNIHSIRKVLVKVILPGV